MSVELVLIPLALAAVANWRAGRTNQTPDGRTVRSVGTRMRDPNLLASALDDTGAQVDRYDDRLIARWEGVAGTFVRREDGIWSAHFEGAVDEQGAMAIVAEIDRAYSRHVQALLVERIRNRASQAGLRVASETSNDQDDVTFVLTPQEAAP